MSAASWRRRAARHPALRLALHPAITLAGLALLLAQVFFGTLYQADHGLYEAQRRFFDYALWAGPLPLPGALSVLWVLALQIVLTALFVLPLKWSKAGLWIAHLGILALLAGGFITNIYAVESQLTLGEGETGHFTTAYHDWELAFWERSGDTNAVTAVAARALGPGAEVALPGYGATLKVGNYYRNCDAFSAQAAKVRYLNPSGVAALEARPPEKEATANRPGITFTLREPGRPDREILLYGLEPRPLALDLSGRKVFAQLRLAHYPLGFSLTLNRFVKQVHQGTDIPSSFESYAQLRDGVRERAVRIWMNNPLRYRGFTLFQASYSQAPTGPPRSTFAVVTNPGRVLPYASSIVIFLGLLVHFAVKLGQFLRRDAQAAGAAP